MNLLSVQGLKKDFDGLSVLEDFSLSVARGDFVSLIGPSGCGKSTFFDLLTGAVPPDEGELLWEGCGVPDLSTKAAWMAQTDLLLPWLSAMENSLLPKNNYTLQDRERAVDLFRKLGLGGFEDYLPNRLSGGMRQRTALARTIMFDRELILLDEPLSALDSLTRQGLQGLLVALQKDFGKTIIMITHDVEEALITSDVVVLLSEQPMEVRSIYEIEGEKPRLRDDPYVVALRKEILGLLRGDIR
ncbi:ABC transporter ATP-binding protein [Dethiosulfovibrio salsuginis]|uniref:NitT/TauT family transport system ATP-binding protein n=1 Tax=Dethiosulfovibrio salsuginis TaxID=561720 RepID=A0A1X7K3C2_9BACT|nr:ABC transporter ATP-binding protein [Dethiosulfovibrio salsuginis]SMG35203.1 NitT/TauT family transport system ATP-binding protein [Dethiosulfovibrio salsuginis]